MLLNSPEKDRSDPRLYRAIYILPAFNKVLERIIVQQLWTTDEALVYLKIFAVHCASNYAFGIFVNFKDLFDYLNLSSILSKLRECS